MIRKLRNSRFLKVLSAFMAVNFVADLFLAVPSFALTSGPSQPEVNSFTPVETSEMVNPFTGDFNYNIPLITVPGPGGGYPINLGYQAGIGMEQEASWVGLGWNINPGAITRSLRGLPDDFSGDEVVKERSMKPDRTLGLTIDLMLVNSEILGADLAKISASTATSLYYNSYRGLGFRMGPSVSLSPACTQHSYTGNVGVDLSFDSQTGLGITPRLSAVFNELETSADLSASINSRQGIQAISLRASKQEKIENVGGNRDGFKNSSVGKWIRSRSGSGSGVTFASVSTLPASETSLDGINIGFSLKTGVSNGGATVDLDLKGNYGENYIPKSRQEINHPAFGYLYAENHGGSPDDDNIMDYQREKDFPVTRHSKVLPIPVQNYDIFQVAGHGVGATLRGVRNDTPVFHEPKAVGNTYSFDFGALYDAGGDIKAGRSLALGYSRSYSGKWKTQGEKDQFSYSDTRTNGEELDQNAEYFQPFTLKANGEQTVNVLPDNDVYNSDPIRFNIKNQWSETTFKGVLTDFMVGPNLTKINLEDLTNQNPVRKTQNIQYLTNDQLGTTTSIQKGHHIGAIWVTNPDGRKYEYNIPVYNTTQKEVTFSVEHDYQGSTDPLYQGKYSKQTTYSSNDNSRDNKKGQDHFYSSTTIPGYAHSYMVENIFSPDYVDADNIAGPSPDDFGSYVHFSYTLPFGSSNPYKWKVPYNNVGNMANLQRGHLSLPDDDKASYVYGEKEIRYVEYIETKTHYARFELSDRKDGFPVTDENGGVNTTGGALKKLDAIKLYKKADQQTINTQNDELIRTVHFEYSYDLCGSVPNNSGVKTDDHPTLDGEFANKNEGKLTLMKVWFSQGEYGTTGKLSPYIFDYDQWDNGQVNLQANPNYNASKMERWGNYQDDNPTNAPFISNQENPYVRQNADYNSDGIIDETDKDARDQAASVWSLKRIILPSGGEINIEYESDDYAYVQDKKSMELVRIVGTGKLDSNGDVEFDGDANLKVGKPLVFFELKHPIKDGPGAEAELYEYIKDIDKLYFKTYQKLKRLMPGAEDPVAGTSNLGYAYDYVEGYADIKKNIVDIGFEPSNTVSIDGAPHFKFGYVTIENVNVGKTAVKGKTHPFRKAGWQYLRLQRPDLFRNPANNLGTVATVGQLLNPALQLYSTVKEGLRLVLGYYPAANLYGYCSQIKVNNNYKPSYIRLNTPDKKKYGGGHRVRKITVSDGWNGMTGEDSFTYGQEFQYTLEDGVSSSGVASYEPIVGGEEIPHRQPIVYSSDQLFNKDKALYTENPLGESYFPSPVVGYSRVLTKNLDHAEVTASAAGYSVNEFYTAKDFPVRLGRTDLDMKRFDLLVWVPFYGMMTNYSKAFSQGYVVELNDMHGKPKSSAVYPYSQNALDNEEFTTKTEYFYNTVSDYSPNSANYLSSHVDVMMRDGQRKTAEIGQHVDVFSSQKENDFYSINLGYEADLTMLGGLVPVPSGFPGVSLNTTNYRDVVTNKVISRNGILKSTKTHRAGSTIVQENLVFDAETGNPVLSSLTNDFEDPIYSYSIPAHHYYENFGGAYRNGGLIIKAGQAANSKALLPGDVLVDGSGNRYYVEDVGANLAIYDGQDNLVNASGLASVKVIRSARRNLQSVSVGSVVSLSNPLTDVNNPLITSLNATTNTLPTEFSFSFTDCLNQTNYDYKVKVDPANANMLLLHEDDPDPQCFTRIVFDDGVDLNTVSNLSTYSLAKEGNAIIATGTGPDLIGRWDDSEACVNECLDNVLQAGAVRFTDGWEYDYAKANAPITSTDANSHPYRYGKDGVYRTQRTYTFDTQRKQTGTASDFDSEIWKDGTFEVFAFFNWQSDDEDANWTRANTVTEYSPYGYELENKDALDIYSAALFGYDNDLPTAVAANCHSEELVFDGFEDYGTSYGPGNSNIVFTTAPSTYPILSVEGIAHTGKHSLLVEDGVAASYETSTGSQFDIVTGNPNNPLEKYFFSAWVKTGQTAQIEIRDQSNNLIGTAMTLPSTSKIEGWELIEGEFSIAGVTDIKVALIATGADAFFDDIRIQPFQSSVQTYVYDPATLWLKAELDANNFATFYNYDENGKLIQTKKETERGIVTLQQNRSNLRRLNP